MKSIIIPETRWTHRVRIEVWRRDLAIAIGAAEEGFGTPVWFAVGYGYRYNTSARGWYWEWHNFGHPGQ